MFALGNYYRPQTKLRKGNFLHLSVSHSVHGEGVSASVHAGIHPPGETPQVDTPWTDTPQADPPWADPPGQTPPADGHCSGWYASYWNVFLFQFKYSWYPEEIKEIRTFLRDQKIILALGHNHTERQAARQAAAASPMQVYGDASVDAPNRPQTHSQASPYTQCIQSDT